MTRPWPYGFAEKEFPQRRKVVKQVKYLLGEKIRMDRHTGGLRERVAPLRQFESFMWGISSRFPLADHFDLPGSKSIFAICQDFPMCSCASLSQDGFYRRGLWVDLATWHHSPFDLQGAFCSWVVREVSWLWEWGICGLLSSFWAGPSILSQLSCYSCLGVLVHRN